MDIEGILERRSWTQRIAEFPLELRKVCFRQSCGQCSQVRTVSFLGQLKLIILKQAGRTHIYFSERRSRLSTKPGMSLLFAKTLLAFRFIVGGFASF